MFDPVSGQQSQQSSERQTQHGSVPGHSFDQIRLHADDTSDSRPIRTPFAVDTPRITSAQTISLARAPITPVQINSATLMVQRYKPPANTAHAIANGHAYNKHVVTQREFPEITNNPAFANRIEDMISAFATRIEDIINNPEEHKALSNGRHAFWKNNTVVIYNPNAADKGTCFKPTGGKSYYDELV
ncbi:hypothetical protein [Roseiflexus sp.]|uniref:hypothetical protein n=1 Tax=Roseiflexus sp. TaxID=2562120 RepID=UPI00398BA102